MSRRTDYPTRHPLGVSGSNGSMAYPGTAVRAPLTSHSQSLNYGGQYKRLTEGSTPPFYDNAGFNSPMSWRLRSPTSYSMAASNPQCQNCKRREDQVTQREDQVTQTQREKAELLEMNVKLCQDNELLIRDMKTLQMELDASKKECNTLKEHRGKMEARLQEVETRLQEVEGENGSLADVNVKLDQSNTFLMGERNGLHYELATLYGRWQMAYEEHSKSMERDITEPLKTRLTEMELEVRQLKEALVLCRKENAILADKNMKLSQSKDDLMRNRDSTLDSSSERLQSGFKEHLKSKEVTMKTSTEPLKAQLIQTEVPFKEPLEQRRKAPGLSGAGKGQEEQSRKAPGLFGASKDQEEQSRKAPGLSGAGKGQEEQSRKAPGLSGAGNGQEEQSRKAPGLSGAGNGQEASALHSKDQISVWSSRKVVPGICGLQNLGGSCYMNAALQCLNSAVLFREHFLQECTATGGAGLLGSYRELMDAMWRGDKGIVKPDRLASEMAQICHYLDGRSPQDSQEFLTTLLENLHGNLKTTVPSTAAKEVTSSHNGGSIVSVLFQGQLRSTLVCGKCAKSTDRNDPFMFLPLNVPEESPRTSIWTLEESLQNLIKEECFEENQWFCPQCKNMAGVRRSIEMAAAPELLIVHLKRFKINTFGCREKINTLVEYPISGFELRPNVVDSQDVYDLFAVINHSGTISGGCYTAFCKHGDQWYHFFDSTVTPLKKGKLVTSGAYVLFYHRTQRKPGLCGIPNFGNTCYISAAMQCLFSLAAVQEYLKAWHHTLSKCPSTDAAHIMAAFSEMVDNIHKGNVAPSGYRKNIELLSLGFQKFSQQDSHEYIMSLLENISKWTETKHRTAQDGKQDVSPISKLFQGVFHSTIQCTNTHCLKKTTREDPFIGISIPVPHQQETTDLKTCMACALGSSMDTSGSAWYCSECHAFSQPRRVTKILTYPKIVIVHLKRFHVNSGVREKVDTIVAFDQVFDLSPYGLDPSLVTSYDLTGVINHYGTIAGGHYIAIRRHEGKWYQFDDTKVTPITAEEVVTPAAYMLFYQR